MQTVYFSDRTLNYSKFKELFEKLQDVEDVDKILISISNRVTNKNREHNFSKTFENISELLEHIKNFKKLDTIQLNFYTNGNIITLKYDYDFTKGWKLEYMKENNVSKSIAYILNDFFKPNSIKNWIYSRIYIIWSLLFGGAIGILLALEDEIPQLFRLSDHIIIVLIFILLGIFIYKLNRRNIPYKNNNFWEEHKAELIQNIIFYILGVVTPYLISFIKSLIV